ncbi:tumor necrosis factor receptor superfamily member 10D-like isoform X1 [Podarcis raffonei]|uniref:tumor necrosis factor receptor superfamily member 10D-like isoform X1 n=1 Tax=Podarcis raffonei TaxID=65483 RepID=UPI002329768F|nr:tumor necrosis factor receptor superfamily member 10D-like isoform X1 [Podarcis raffonei]
MAVALRAAVLLMALALQVVESPRLIPQCDHGKYLDSGRHCCKLCPAGTYVAESCITPHTSGICAPCQEGIDYTAHANGFQKCLPCDDCKSGFEMVKSCTVKSNTECRCKAGYYCPPSCEECVKCNTKCPEGQILVENCNATTDIKCVSSTETKTATSNYIAIAFVVVVVAIIAFGVIALFCWKSTRNGFCQSDEVSINVTPYYRNMSGILSFLPSPYFGWTGLEVVIVGCVKQDIVERCKKKNPGPNGASSESLLINQMEKPGPVSENKLPGNTDRSDLAAGNTNEPLLGSTESTAASLQPNLQGSRQQPEVVVVASAENSDSVKVLNEIYFDSRKQVPLYDWKNLMRKSGLEDNDIAEIEHDHPSQTGEQRYQMLKALQNRYGIKDALLKLLNGMWAMKLTHIYDNLTNELKSKGIITLETKD